MQRTCVVICGVLILTSHLGWAEQQRLVLLRNHPAMSTCDKDDTALEIAYTDIGEIKPLGRDESHTAALQLSHGFAKNWEVVLGWDGYVFRGGYDEDSGIGDTSIGIKHRVASIARGSSEGGILARVDLPTGADEVSADETGGLLALSGERTLAKVLLANATIGYLLKAVPEKGDPLQKNTQSFLDTTVGVALQMTDRIRVASDLVGKIPLSDSGEPALALEFSLLYRFLQGASVGLDAGFGLNDDAYNSTFGMVIGCRI